MFLSLTSVGVIQTKTTNDFVFILLDTLIAETPQKHMASSLFQRALLNSITLEIWQIPMNFQTFTLTEMCSTLFQ